MKSTRSSSHIEAHAISTNQLRAGSHLTQDGGIVRVGDAGDVVHAQEHALHMRLVQMDGIGVSEEVIAVLGSGGPVCVRTPEQSDLHLLTSTHAFLNEAMGSCLAAHALAKRSLSESSVLHLEQISSCICVKHDTLTESQSACVCDYVGLTGTTQTATSK
jgi:hypothetical protein